MDIMCYELECCTHSPFAAGQFDWIGPTVLTWAFAQTTGEVGLPLAWGVCGLTTWLWRQLAGVLPFFWWG